MKMQHELARAVATLLSQGAATHPDFFFHVSTYMEEKGYTLLAHQRGIQGTHIEVKKHEAG